MLKKNLAATIIIKREHQAIKLGDHTQYGGLGVGISDSFCENNKVPMKWGQLRDMRRSIGNLKEHICEILKIHFIDIAVSGV